MGVKVPHSYFVTFLNLSIRLFSFFIILIFSSSSFAADCSFGGAGKVLQFPAGTTEYDYATVNPYLYSCIATEFRDSYVNAGMQITVKTEIKNESDLDQIVAGLKQGKYTNSSSGLPNSDKDVLENVGRFARKVTASCTKDSNYMASVNAMSPTSFSSEVDQFISYCYQISQLDSLTLSLDSSGRTTLDPNLITDVNIREYYIQCESTAAPALACKALCDSSAPDQFKQIGCDQFRNKYTGPQPAIAALAEQCVPFINTNPQHESCQQLCNAQSSSCLDGLTAASGDPAADSGTGTDTAATDDQTSGSGDTTNPTGADNDKLADLAARTANNLFGGGNGMGFNGNNSNQGDVTSPTNSIGSGLKASGLNAGNNNGQSQLKGQAATVLPASLQFPMNTRGEPGGTKKDSSAGGGGGPRGGGGGGGFSGSGGGAGGGKGDSRNGRRYGSKNTKAEDIDLNRFLGTSGIPSAGSPASALSQKLKDQIDKNKNKDQSGNTNKINAAFQNGLKRGTSNSSGFLSEGQFFPEAEAAYEYIRNSEVLPNEKGHL